MFTCNCLNAAMWVDSASFYRWDSSVNWWDKLVKVPWGTSEYQSLSPTIMVASRCQYKGVEGSTMTYDVTSTPQQSWFVILFTHAEAKVRFIEPCINDFHPQFTPYNYMNSLGDLIARPHTDTGRFLKISCHSSPTTNSNSFVCPQTEIMVCILFCHYQLYIYSIHFQAAFLSTIKIYVFHL